MWNITLPPINTEITMYLYKRSLRTHTYSQHSSYSTTLYNTIPIPHVKQFNHAHILTRFSGWQDICAVTLLTETGRQVTVPCIWLLSKLKQKALDSQPTWKYTWGFTDTSWNNIVNMTSKQVAFIEHRSWPDPLTLRLNGFSVSICNLEKVYNLL